MSVTSDNLDTLPKIAHLPKTRAKECLSALTTGERTCFSHIIKNTFDETSDAPFVESLKNKLNACELDSSSPIPREKDDGVNCLKLMIVNVWRAIKNIFGSRISSTKLYDMVLRYDAQNQINKEKQEFLTKFLSEEITATDDILKTKTNSLMGTERYEEEIFKSFPEQCQILGVAEGDSLETAEEAYLDILLSDATPQVKQEAGLAYSVLYIFNEIEAQVFPLKTMKRSLQEAVNGLPLRGLTGDAKITANRHLLALCALYEGILDL